MSDGYALHPITVVVVYRIPVSLPNHSTFRDNDAQVDGCQTNDHPEVGVLEVEFVR